MHRACLVNQEKFKTRLPSVISPRRQQDNLSKGNCQTSSLSSSQEEERQIVKKTNPIVSSVGFESIRVRETKVTNCL
jgi:hypothetical protein